MANGANLCEFLDSKYEDTDLILVARLLQILCALMSLFVKGLGTLKEIDSVHLVLFVPCLVELLIHIESPWLF